MELVRAGKLSLMRLNFSSPSDCLKKAIIDLGNKKADDFKEESFAQIAQKYDTIQRQSQSDDEFIALCFNYYFANKQLLPDIVFLVFDKEQMALCYEDEHILWHELAQIQEILSPILKFNFVLRDGTSFISKIEKRITDVEHFYIEKYGEWLENFMHALGDDISKSSFKTFLKQRLHGHILWDAHALYPIKPPKLTQKWRNERLANPPTIPNLSGADKECLQFVLIDTFVLEQYAIPGVVEAQPGDTVIDAGAYIGDTALYFAKKGEFTFQVQGHKLTA